MTDSNKLSQSQLHALLDILSHHELYAEIFDFRLPGSLSAYGPPFSSNNKDQYVPDTPSTSPSLQSLLSKFALTLPGLRDVSTGFWQQQCASLVEDLEKAELSESYDKGTIGIRKTLATALSALMEYPVRGIFAGFDAPDASKSKDAEYDTSNAEDLQRAFRDLMQLAIYDTIVDDMFKKAAETDKLADHAPLVKAVHEYGLVNLASFMHYTLILSPKGQSLLTLIDHANKMIPYTIIKQTLKIGNVATMINAMMKVVLAKMSVATVTNWIGWTNSADEGMNLLQQIISAVLNWETRELKSRAGKIEKNKKAPSKEQLSALKDYLSKSREDHDCLRSSSITESRSIADVVLSNASVSADLNEQQHALALEYLAINLAIRDREQIVRVLCHSNPDHVTQAVRDLVNAYEPMIRQVHSAVDLSDTVTDFEHFLSDMIKLAKLPSDSNSAKHPVPTAGDFVQLLKKHQGSSHKFIHQVARNGKEVTSWFHEYATQAASHFRQSSHSSDSNAAGKGAGDLTSDLEEMFTSLPEQQQKDLIPVLDAHAAYLAHLHDSSARRLAAVIASPSRHPALSSSSRVSSRTASPSRDSAAQGGALRPPSSGDAPTRGNSSSSAKSGASSSAGNSRAEATDPGPGAFLARWQDLLDRAPITPETSKGKVRSGGSGSVIKSSEDAVDHDNAAVEGAESGGDSGGAGKTEAAAADRTKAPPHAQQGGSGEDVMVQAHDKMEADIGKDADVQLVVDALGKNFREVLGRKACVAGK